MPAKSLLLAQVCPRQDKVGSGLPGLPLPVPSCPWSSAVCFAFKAGVVEDASQQMALGSG